MTKLRHGGFMIAKIHQLAGRIFTRKLKAYNVDEINTAQGRIMFVLWRNEGISIQELAELTSLGKSTLTSMLDRLEEAGYISRVPSGEDRRKVLVYTTEKDNELMGSYERIVGEMTDIFYKDFTDEDIEKCEDYLRRIFFNLTEHKRKG
jgi:MarR family transcriptional regulator, organic hydroperoxide resistance regulator